MDKSARILVTGGYGFIGHNLVDYLQRSGYRRVVGEHPPNWTESEKCRDYFSRKEPDYVFHCAGRVRGIAGNMADQEAAYRENVLINTNVVHACIEHKVKKLVALGTVAMYGYAAFDTLLTEEWLTVSNPHKSEHGYAMAKRGMLAHLEVSGLNWAMPICTNMYGPHDRFDTEHGHCIPSLVRKFHEGNPVVWGDGQQKRDFLYVRDAVRALVMIMEKGQGIINLATGRSRSIDEAARCLADLSKTGFRYDHSRPVGQVERSYDITRLRQLGFEPQYTLERGLEETYKWYAENHATARKG